VWFPSCTTIPERTIYYLGIDVHKHDSYIAVLEQNAEIVEEVRVEHANLDKFAEQYAGSKAVIEAPGNYFTIYDTLNEHLDVVVTDPFTTLTRELSTALT
jgi:transposase